MAVHVLHEPVRVWPLSAACQTHNVGRVEVLKRVSIEVLKRVI